jgi:hypothetical protein
MKYKFGNLVEGILEITVFEGIALVRVGKFFSRSCNFSVRCGAPNAIIENITLFHSLTRRSI